MLNAYIKEIFTSIQGEGPYIGEKQIFVRFCGCNLHCAYCDTNFEKPDKFYINELSQSFDNPITSKSLSTIVQNLQTETISLTGGEPLLHKDFLLEFLPQLKSKRIYLETNGTLYNELKEVIKYIDIISMDIKLSCSTAQDNQFDANTKFIEIAHKAQKEIFVKIVLDKNYSKEELLEAIKIVKKFDVFLIIQPMDCKDKINNLDSNSLIELFDFMYQNYPKIRLIPQVHKFLGFL